jgi:hypothetical protein
MARIAVGGVSRIWGKKRLGMRSNPARTRARGLLSAVLRIVAGQTSHRSVVCIATVGGGWLQSFSPHEGGGGTENSSVHLQGLTDVEQHNLGRSPSLEIKECGAHVVDC